MDMEHTWIAFNPSNGVYFSVVKRVCRYDCSFLAISDSAVFMTDELLLDD